MAVKRTVTDGLARQVDAQGLDTRQVGERAQGINGVAQNPPVNARCEVKALCRGQKRAGWHHAAVGVDQANQHLGIQTMRFRVQGLNPLGVQREAVFVQRMLNACGPLHFALASAHGLVRIQPDVNAAAPGLLRGMTCGICGLNDCGGGVPPTAHRHQADAGTGAKAFLVVRKAKVVDAVTNFLGNGLRLVDGAMVKNHRKLIATQPGHRVVRTHRLTDQLADLLQKLIASRVATRIVDELELVQVDEQQCVLHAVLMRFFKRALQAAFKLGTVKQPGQHVMRGAVGHLATEPTLLGHIVKNQHHTQQRILLVANGRCRILNPKLVPRARNQQGVVSEADDLALLQTNADGAFFDSACLLMNDMKHLADRVPLRLSVEPASHAFGHGVEPSDPASVVGGDDGIADGLQGDLQQLVLRCQLGGDIAKVCDVLHRADQFDGLTAFVYGSTYRSNPNAFARGLNKGQLKIPAFAGDRRLVDCGLNDRQHLRRIKLGGVRESRYVAGLHAIDAVRLF